MNADKNKQDGSFPEADEVYKAAAPRQSAARKRVSPRPAWLAERPEVRVRKDLAAFFEFFTPLHFCVAHPSGPQTKDARRNQAIVKLFALRLIQPGTGGDREAGRGAERVPKIAGTE